MPAGKFGIPLDNLRNIIAETASFQFWVGAADAATAKDSTYLFSRPLSTIIRPLCVVWLSDKWVSEKQTEGLFLDRAELSIAFEWSVPPAHINPITGDVDVIAAAIQFIDEVGIIVDDLAKLSGINGLLNIVELKGAEPPIYEPDSAGTQGGPHFQFYYEAVWSN